MLIVKLVLIIDHDEVTIIRTFCQIRYRVDFLGSPFFKLQEVLVSRTVYGKEE